MKSLVIGLFFLFVSASAFPAESDESKSRKEIVNLLQNWPEDFNNKNIPAVCGLFASDLVASYPGVPDKNYEEMCKKLTASLSDPDRIYRYQSPKIEQIIIEGNLVVVRLIWTLEVLDKNQKLIERVEEKGLDVFRRQKDNSWKITISYAYPINR